MFTRTKLEWVCINGEVGWGGEGGDRSYWKLETLRDSSVRNFRKGEGVGGVPIVCSAVSGVAGLGGGREQVEKGSVIVHRYL